MSQVSLSDLFRLLAATDKPDDHLKKLFEWRIERTLTALRLLAATIAGVVIAAATAVFRGDLEFDSVACLLVVITALLGGAQMTALNARVGELEREYVFALDLLREHAPLVPLLRLYGSHHGHS